MPLTLICRRCNTNVQTDDRFCQECGFDLKNNNAENASASVPQSGNNFDFSPSESKRFEWPSLVEDPAGGDAKAFSIPAFDRKFSRYKDKEANWEGSGSPDQIEPIVQQAGGAQYAELNEQTCATADILQNPQSTTIETTQPLVSTTEADTITQSTITDSSTKNAVSDSTAQATTSAPVDYAAFSGAPSTAVSSDSTSDAANIDTKQAVKRLHSPLLEKETVQKTAKQPGRPVFLMDAAAIIAVIAFAIALGSWGYNNYNKTGQSAEKKTAEKAQVNSKNAELLASYKSLFALSILSQKGLDTNQQKSFDDAAFRLGQEAYNAGKFAEAQDYLKNVSSACANYAKAQDLINSAQKGMAGSSNQDLSAATQPLQIPKDLRRQSVFNAQTLNAQPRNTQLSERKVLSIPVLPELDAPSSANEEESVTESGEEPSKAGNGLVIEMAGEANSNTETNQPATTTTSGGGVLSFSPENAFHEGRPRRTRHKTSTNAGTSNSATRNKSADEPTPKFSESEISVYNRLLGRFIAAHGQKSAQPEPPSFKEWIRKGKPAF